MHQLLLQKENRHFKFYSTNEDKLVLIDLENILEKNYTSLTNKFNVTFSSPIIIKIYPTLLDLHNSLPLKNLKKWNVGCLFNNEILMISPLNPGKFHTYDSLIKVIIHEFIHLIISKITLNAPLYLNEGLAIFHANQLNKGNKFYLKCKAKVSLLPSISKIEENPFSFSQPYFLVGSLAEFLIHTYGYNKVLFLLTASMPLDKFLNISYSTLNKNWRNFILKTY